MMRRVIALLLALVMALGCANVLAEDNAYENVTVQSQVQLNKDMVKMLAAMFAGEEVPQELLDAVLDMVNALSFDVAFDGEKANIVLSLKGKPIATLEGGMLEDGSLALTTNVLPGYAFYVDAQTLEMVKTEMMSAMYQVDTDKIMQAAEKLEKDVVQRAEAFYATSELAKNIVVEAGSYVMDNVTFTLKKTINTDTNAAAKELQALAKEMMPLLEEFFTQAGLPLEMLAEMKRDIEEEFVADAEPIPMYVTVYQKAVGENVDPETVCCTFEMANDEGALAMVVFAGGKEMECSLYFGEGSFESAQEIQQAANEGSGNAFVMNMAMLQGENENDANMMVDLQMAGLYVGVYGEAKEVDGGLDRLGEVYFLSGDQPLVTMRNTVRPMTEKLPAINVEGKELVNLLTLAEEGEEMGLALAQNLSDGLSQLLVSAVVAAPDEVQNLLSAIAQMSIEMDQTTSDNEWDDDYSWDDEDWDDEDWDDDYSWDDEDWDDETWDETEETMDDTDYDAMDALEAAAYEALMQVVEE